MQSRFIDFIKTIAYIPPAQESNFNELNYVMHFRKNENLVTAGEFPKSVAFLTDGLFRYYYINREGVEFTKGFFISNMVLIPKHYLF